ncbi:uncharacterized protein Z520_00194 [Fonsecaea multimorphosa CBS 102226]|uniref:Uncharacterized protein n=1 Tax=Fonsecaea multimorphosa CBS 102226 TaxID=1442371 RepID=A0A0D2KBQ9_9EURO|nr:uncharacterized protein Z520_00194 [Fonsecaea multimorphosa CBS 102226]KIY03503.1 hypothetical protein Z520_00194 [Fonsecaea multimorphosa CBS 102226]
MPKGDFQHLGDHHKIIDGVHYPAQILEGNEQLVNHALDSVSLEGGEKWNHIERPAISNGQTNSTNGAAPWHALVAVKKEDVPNGDVSRDDTPN